MKLHTLSLKFGKKKIKIKKSIVKLIKMKILLFLTLIASGDMQMKKSQRFLILHISNKKHMTMSLEKL
jgi:hypothetical protein